MTRCELQDALDIEKQRNTIMRVIDVIYGGGEMIFDVVFSILSMLLNPLIPGGSFIDSSRWRRLNKALKIEFDKDNLDIKQVDFMDGSTISSLDRFIVNSLAYENFQNLIDNNSLCSAFKKEGNKYVLETNPTSMIDPVIVLSRQIYFYTALIVVLGIFMPMMITPIKSLFSIVKNIIRINR